MIAVRSGRSSSLFQHQLHPTPKLTHLLSGLDPERPNKQSRPPHPLLLNASFMSSKTLKGSTIRGNSVPWIQAVPVPASPAATLKVVTLSLEEVKMWQTITRKLRSKLDSLDCEKSEHEWRGILKDVSDDDGKQEAELVAETELELEEKETELLAALRAQVVKPTFNPMCVAVNQTTENVLPLPNHLTTLPLLRLRTRVCLITTIL